MNFWFFSSVDIINRFDLTDLGINNECGIEMENWKS
jgi:hypothetical protein